ncbi:MAG: aldo/keto reductase [Capsulimonas sp.]|uniref:aldo/keto reductase n=1 Tax=Capsulimonas sp. TaxID=2494211 RepID=UPI0032644D63
MKYNSLGRTGAQVSNLCLGAMTFGWKTEEDEAFRIVDRFMEAGGNFVDTANVYGRGKSEIITGKALARDGKRDRIFLATKAHGKMNDDDPNAWGNHAFNIIRACEASLQRLGADHIDLYQIHRPQSSIPIDETLRALDHLVRSGKVRYIGTSTYAAWQVLESLWVSKEYGLSRFVTEQPPYNILDRRIERELIPLSQSYGIGIIPWSPLAGGKLTGKYKRDQAAPDNSREDPAKFAEGTWKALEGLDTISQEKGVTPTAFALAWLNAMPGVTSPIIGPNSVAQLEDNLAASEVEITDEDKKRVDALVAPGTHVEDYYKADFGPNARW